MHEMGIAESIAATVIDQAQRYHATNVREVHLRIGEAHVILSDALISCFTAITMTEPLLHDALLTIEEIPHRGRCQNCGNEFHIEQFMVLCPTCGALTTEVISGNEFDIIDMDIDIQEEGS
jgi:hydrogenase nickel incorporation protein HypA/HybF